MYISDSDIEASCSQQRLAAQVTELLESNRDVTRRLHDLENSYETSTYVRRQPNTIFTFDPDADEGNHGATDDNNRTSLNDGRSTPTPATFAQGFLFERDLETSRVYRRATRDDEDVSFHSSVANTHAWSALSDLSLSDISNVSILALPLSAQDMTNSCDCQIELQPILATFSDFWSTKSGQITNFVQGRMNIDLDREQNLISVAFANRFRTLPSPMTDAVDLCFYAETDPNELMEFQPRTYTSKFWIVEGQFDVTIGRPNVMKLLKRKLNRQITMM
jgi:hypothetical protein